MGPERHIRYVQAARRVLVQEADRPILFQMRLAKDLQCLKVKSYAFASTSIDEIGRLIGGWLRSRGDHKA